jgi:hypothetical protein
VSAVLRDVQHAEPNVSRDEPADLELQIDAALEELIGAPDPASRVEALGVMLELMQQRPREYIARLDAERLARCRARRWS